MENMSLSDIAAVTRGNEGFGDGNGWWIILILLFALGGNNFGGGNRRTATTDDVVYTSAFNQLQDENTAIRSDIQRTAYDNMTNVKDVAYNNLSEIRQLQGQTALGFSNVENRIGQLSRDMEACCCSLKTQMLQDKYDAVVQQLNQAQNALSNTAQSSYLLQQLGQWRAYPPCNPNPCGCNSGIV